MNTIIVTPEMRKLHLGRVGENERTQFVFDVSDLVEEYPDADIVMLNQRPGEYTAYECELSAPDEDGKVEWTITSEELTKDGDGICQIQATDGTTKARTKTWDTEIDKGLYVPEEE